MVSLCIISRTSFDVSTDTMDLIPTTVSGSTQTIPNTTMNVSVQNSVASTPRTLTTTSNQIQQQHEMTFSNSSMTTDKLLLPLPTTTLFVDTATETLPLVIHSDPPVPCSKPTDLIKILPIIVSFLSQRNHNSDDIDTTTTSSRKKGDRSDNLVDDDMYQTKVLAKLEADSPVDLSRQSTLSDLSNCLEHQDGSYYYLNTIEPPITNKPIVMVPIVSTKPSAATNTSTSSNRLDHITVTDEDNTGTGTRKNSSEGTAMSKNLLPLPAVSVNGLGMKRKLSSVSSKTTTKPSNLRNFYNDGVIPPLVKLASDGTEVEGGSNRNDDSGGDNNPILFDAKDREKRISRRNPSNGKNNASQVKTIVIFPINTAHKMTSTDDLNPVPSDESKNRIINASFTGDELLSENINSATTTVNKENSGVPRQLSSKHIQRSLSNLASLSKTTSNTTTNANTTSSSNYAHASSRLLGPIWKELEMSRICAIDLEAMISKAEENYRNLVVRNKEISTSTGDIDVSTMSKLIETLHNMLGKIILSIATTESNLSEYRTLFETEGAGGGGVSEISRNSTNHLEYEKCRQLYLDCHHRVAISVNRLQTLRPQIQKVVQSIQGQSSHTAVTPPLPRTPITPSTISKFQSVDSEHHQSPLPSPYYSKLEEQLVTMKIELLALEETNIALKTELENAETDIVELEKELFEAEQANDRTPGALVFFAALGDESIPLSLKQLVLQLSQMKSFSESFEHVDFISLRKRLQVCVDCVPTLQRFLSKFTTMYNKWQQDRYKLFLDRSGSINGIDTNNMCPLCFVDTRHTAPSSTPLLSLTSSNNIIQGTIKNTTSSLVASPARSSSKLRKGATSSHINNVTTSSSRMLTVNNHSTPTVAVNNSISTNMSSLSISSPTTGATGGGGGGSSINTTGSTTFPIRKMNSSSMISYDAGGASLLSQPNLPTIAKRK